MQNGPNNLNATLEKSAVISTPVDLNAPGVAAALSKRLKVEIDDYCATAYDDGHRKHLGASLIGEPCKRKLWFIFRWAFREQFSGRMQRLFNRGHREEERFVEWLRGIGCEVWTHDESQPKNAKGEYPQYRISGVMGHFGGSLDAIVKLPPQYNIPVPLLGEFKTNGTGAGFNKLTTSGMEIAKPQHFAQTSLYGWKYGFTHVVYQNICKNDDDLHLEVVKLNWKEAARLEQKAAEIITSQKPPPRLSDNPTYKDCQYCPAKDLCHNNKLPDKNCRSCVNAVPVEGGQWLCTFHNGNIPDEFIKLGCDYWKPIV